MSDFQHLPLLTTPDVEEAIRKDIEERSYDGINDHLEETTKAITKLSKRSIWARFFRNKTSAGIKLALSNPVILDNILKYLNHEDKNSFRAVNKTIFKYNLEKWKNENWIRIDSDSRFLNLYRSYLRIVKEKKVKIDEYLEDHVFSHVIFSELECIQKDSEIHEKFFWKYYAPHITYISLDYCGLEKSKEVFTIGWILSKCPNLVELRINSYFCVKRKYVAKEKDVGEVAVNLESLHLDHVDFLDVNDPILIKIAANLKALTGNSTTIWNKMEKQQGGGFSNLRKLDITLLKAVDFLCFINYVAKYGTNLQELFVKANEKSFNESEFYQALGQCFNLQKLKLHFEVPKSYNFNPAGYSRLSSVNFSNLKSFHLKISTEKGVFLINLQNFDLNILKGMPNLEELHLSLSENIKRLQRQSGIGNWVDPATTTSQFSDPACKKLKKLTLDGFWPLKRDDVFLFYNWFPSLQYFRAAFNLDSFTFAIKLWEKTMQVIVAGHRSDWVGNERMERFEVYYKYLHVFNEFATKTFWDRSEIELRTRKE